eukprot:IDg4578t1
MAGDEESKIQKFHGRPSDDYNLWRLRAECALKGKGYWKQLQEEDCKSEIKEKAVAMIIHSLGDIPFRVCSSQISNPMSMMELLDQRYASTRSTSRISTLTTLYSIKYQKHQDMSKYVDEFEGLFAQLERMGKETAIPESHKAPLLLASIGTNSALESTVAALRLKDTSDLTWHAVTADLIQEYKRLKDGSSSSQHKPIEKYNKNSLSKGKLKHALGAKNNRNCMCGFCGKSGHETKDCFLNPESPSCKLTDQAKESIRALSVTDIKAEKQYLDSGASITLFKRKLESDITTYNEGSDDTVQLAAGDRHAKVLGEASLCIGNLSISKGLHVDSLNDTLVSVDESAVIDVVPRDVDSGLYVFSTHQKNTEVNTSDQKGLSTKIMPDNIDLWHNRLIHTNSDILRSLQRHATDFPVLKGDLKVCHPCRLGKATKKSFNSKFKETEYAGEVVHSDLAGPMPVSMDGAQYACTFTDQYSRFSYVTGLCNKSDVLEATESYKQLEHVQKYFKKGIERVHTDGGGEYSGINIAGHSTTTPHTPQHNPFSERLNRTWLEPVRTILEQSGLSARYWEYAMDHVVFIKNRLPHKGINCSPYEKLTWKKPVLKHVRVFGCASFIYEHAPKSKVHARATPGILLGCNDHGVFTVERLTDGKIINSVHVSFDESVFPGLDRELSSSSGDFSGSDTYKIESNNSDSDSCYF